MIELLLSSIAWPSPPDLLESLGAGVQVNWSTMQLEIDASARSPATGSVQAVEELARREVEAAVRQTVGDIAVTANLLLEEVLEDATIGVAVRARTARWRIREATYGRSGRVNLVAVLSLQDLLKPWVLTHSLRGRDPSVALQRQRYTGVVLDARNTDARPAYAPRLIAPDSGVLFQAEMEEERAVQEPPFRFVTDPGHPMAIDAGDRPLVVMVDRARGSDLYLSAAEAKVVGAQMNLLRQGTIVVVLDDR